MCPGLLSGQRGPKHRMHASCPGLLSGQRGPKHRMHASAPSTLINEEGEASCEVTKPIPHRRCRVLLDV